MIKSKKEVMKDLGKVRRRKLVIQKRQVLKDEIGQQTEKWVDWKTLWVERGSLWGEEYYAAKVVNEENTIEFTIKHVSFVEDINSVDYRVFYNGSYYDIKNIDYINDDGTWVKIKALGSGASG